MTEDFVHADFNLGTLDHTDLDPNPIAQFTRWYEEVRKAGITEYPAMSVATVGADGRPSARILYLRGYDDRGFAFYTNYESRKGLELGGMPYTALCFYWKELERQVRIEGHVEKLTPAESDAYFADRPLDNQIGAWASTQSHRLESAEVLASRVDELKKKYDGGPVPRPPFWGGYRVVPDRIEFWQGRPSRLHDRFLYTRSADGIWSLDRLNP